MSSRSCAAPFIGRRLRPALGVMSNTVRPLVSIDVAIRRGLFYVNGPVAILLFLPMCLSLAFFHHLTRAFNSEAYAFIASCGAFLVGFVLAWLWWSYSVPRWRIWAYARVANIPDLKVRAVQVGLTWPDGHIFERTEFKRASVARRQRTLEHRGKNDV